MNGHKICPLCHVRSGNDYTNSSSLGKLGTVYQLPAQVEKWPATHEKSIPSWRSLYMLHRESKKIFYHYRQETGWYWEISIPLNIGFATFHLGIKTLPQSHRRVMWRGQYQLHCQEGQQEKCDNKILVDNTATTAIDTSTPALAKLGKDGNWTPAKLLRNN